jgi:mxaA protein
MVWTRRSLAIALCLAGLVSFETADAANTVDFHAPRAFGYFIGDLFTHEVTVHLDPGISLDRASLPRRGPLTYWLDLVSVDLEETGTIAAGKSYRLYLLYQTFYAPLEPKSLTTPVYSLSARSPEETIHLEIPAWPFLMSPLREIIPSKAGASMDLQPDVDPRPHQLMTEQRLILVSLALATSALLALAWRRGWGFFGKRQRPFGSAARKIKRYSDDPANVEAYLSALLTLHRAFDAAAGRRLLADDLALFLNLRPGFRAAATEIARFFAASRQAFFGAGTESARSLLPICDLGSLARRLAQLERAGA